MVSFDFARSTTIGAPAAAIHPLLDDLRLWQDWSPWEGLDPDLRRTYSDPSAGVGASYAWEGGRKAGAGSMTITRSTPAEVALDLVFRKPFPARSTVVLTLLPEGVEQTRVTWRLYGESTGVAGLLARVVPTEKLIGKDLERGLERLRVRAEGV